MKQFQILSDIHLEYYNNDIQLKNFIDKSANNLILLGDIGSPLKENYWIFINQCSLEFKKVFLISGNHEYFITDDSIEPKINYNDIDDLIKKKTDNYDNVYYLNNEVYEDEKFVILGTTLWSLIPRRKYMFAIRLISDYKYIYKDNCVILPLFSANKFKKNIHWINEQLMKYEDKEKDIIIASHHAPSLQAINEKYRNFDCNEAYANNLDDSIKDTNIKYWLFGHTHQSCYFTINNTTCISNPLGYIKNNVPENKKFNRSCTFDL